MRKRMTSACVAVTFALLIGVAARASDEQIGKQIVERLQERRQAAQLEGFNIGVQVENGTVTMSGNVSTEEQAGVALDVARRVPGVKLVVNDLRVQPAAVAPAPAVTQPAVYTTTFPPATQPATVQVTAPTTCPTADPLIQATLPPGAAGFVPQPRAVAAPPQPPRSPATAHSSQPLAFARGTLSADRLQPGPARGLTPAQYVEEYGSGVGDVPMGESYVGEYGGGYSSGSPVPMSASGMTMPGGTPAYDNPQMPAYAWPSYAAYPNYAALTYPHQYSPTAWPYIGPFYPYPQVPLGWRKVMLEWDDGWWYLDFLSK